MANAAGGPAAYSLQDNSGYEDYDSSYYDVNDVKPSFGTGPAAGNGASTVTQSAYDSDHNVSDNKPFQPDRATQALIDELKAELAVLDATKNKNAVRLITNEVERLSSFGEPEFIEVDIPKPIKVVRKILIPVNREPKFNYVGKLLGPGGKTLQNLISSTRCRIYILGRGSSRDKAKEQEMLSSGDPRHAHFKEPLHIRVESSGPPTVAYEKIAHVLNELQYYLQPVKDDIYMQQMTDMGKPMVPNPAAPPARAVTRGPLMGAAPPGRGGGAPRGSPRGAAPTRGRSYLMQTPPGPPAGQNSGNAGGPPPNYVTYPGYDYGSYGDQQSSVQSATPAPAFVGGHTSAAPRPLAPQAGPPQAAYGDGSSYNQPYGYEYSNYGPPDGQGSQPHYRPPGPPRGGGKAGRGRGMPPRVAPY